MILLGIDTCGATGTLALARVPASGEPGPKLEMLATAELPGRSAAAMLVPQLRQMLLDSGVSMAEVTGLVVVDGPGSFTGIRIGISTAKALADACSLPLFAVSRLRVLARSNGLSGAVLDAGRGEYFYGVYPVVGESCFPADQAADSQPEWLLTADELRARLLSGEAYPAVCEQKVAAVFPQARMVAETTAAAALHVALPQVFTGQQAEVAGLDGRYLRRSDLYRTASGK